MYITHKTINYGQIGDLTAVAKRIILKKHALSKNNLHELLAEPKINKHIKYHIANQNRQEARGILKKPHSKQFIVNLVQNKKNCNQVRHQKQK